MDEGNREIHLGAKVLARDGGENGKVAKVVFDPDSGQLVSLVVEVGRIMVRDVLVGAEHVLAATDQHVTLDLTTEETGELPEFVPTDFRVPDPNWTPPYDWSLSGVFWLPTSAPLPPAETAFPRTEQITVGVGTEVVASDGEKVGKVAQVTIAVGDNRPTNLVLRRGTLINEDVAVPDDWVGAVDGNQIALRVDKTTVDGLTR